MKVPSKRRSTDSYPVHSHVVGVSSGALAKHNYTSSPPPLLPPSPVDQDSEDENEIKMENEI